MKTKLSKSKRNNIFFLIVLIVFIVPQTRQPIQVVMHKMFSFINPVNVIKKADQVSLKNYNWVLKDEKGNDYNFNAAKGKIVVINFWATWCPPCIAEMPSLQKLYDAYNKEVVFLFVTDELNHVTTKFKKRKGYTFPVFQPQSISPKEFLTKSIPRTILLDKNGNIVIDKYGAVDWFSTSVKQRIESLIKNQSI